MNRLVKVAALLAVPFLLSACGGGWKLYTTSEYGQVKKIAIVSLITNNDIHPVGGGKSLTSLATLVAKKSGNSSLAGSGQRIAELGLQAFAQEFSKVNGWVIMPPEAVIASDEYKAFVANNALPSAASAIVEIGLTTPAGMYNAYQITNTSGKEVLEPLGALAKKLGADGVAVIRLDLAYEAHSAAFGMGTAVASVAADIKIVNQSGAIVAKTAEYANPKAAVGLGFRQKSDQKAPLVAGELVYTSSVEDMFKDAIVKNAVFIREEINKR